MINLRNFIKQSVLTAIAVPFIDFSSPQFVKGEKYQYIFDDCWYDYDCSRDFFLFVCWNNAQKISFEIKEKMRNPVEAYILIGTEKKLLKYFDFYWIIEKFDVCKCYESIDRINLKPPKMKVEFKIA